MAVDTPANETELEIEGNDEDEAAEANAFAQTSHVIRTQAADPEIDSLYSRWKRGRLILQPFFQRQFVWD